LKDSKLRNQDWLFAKGEDSRESSLLSCGIPRLWRRFRTQTRILITGLNFSRIGPRLRRSKGRDPSLRKKRDWL